jgi:hypothetical protein
MDQTIREDNMSANTPRQQADEKRSQPDPFDEGCRAAAEGIPAVSNPYPAGSDKRALWQDGHEVGAQALESGQTEDS